MQWKVKAGVEAEDGWGLNIKDTVRNCKNEKKKIEHQKYLQSDEKNYYVQGGIQTVQEVAAKLKC